MKVALSALFALGAAVLFGVSSVLQQAAARSERDVPLLGLSVVRRLVRRPRWLAAVLLSAASFVVQAIALAFGPLALVQPIAATDLLFALIFLAVRRHAGPRLVDWLASLMVVGGIAAFLGLSPPAAGRLEPSLADWAVVLAIGTGAVTILVAMALRLAGIMRTAMLAGAGAVVWALVDSLTKAVVGLVGAHGVAALLHWEPYALLVAGLSGITLGQGAYRSGSLLVSLPIIDSVEPVGAVAIGAAAFGEHIGGSPILMALQVLMGFVAVAGIVTLARSPLLASTSAPHPTAAECHQSASGVSQV